MPRLSQQDPRVDTGRYSVKKLSVVLPEVQTGEID